MIYDFTGATVWGHSGNHRGQSSYLRIVPEHDLVIAAGGTGGAVLQLSDELGDGLVTELTGARPAPSLCGRSSRRLRRKWTSRR